MNKNTTRHRPCLFCKKEFRSDANRQVFCCLRCRLLSEVATGGADTCWNWRGAKDRDGYGRFRWNYAMFRAHVEMWKISNPKKALPYGVCVLHTCDNPSCCNPNHLWPGTNLDNVQDRNQKGRTRCNPKAGDNGRKSPRDTKGRFIKRREGMCGI